MRPADPRLHALWVDKHACQGRGERVGGGWVLGNLQGSVSVARQRSTHQPARPQQNPAARTTTGGGAARRPRLSSSPPDTTTPMSSTMFMMSDAVPAEELPTVTASDMAPMAAGGGFGVAAEGGGRSAGRQGGGFDKSQWQQHGWRARIRVHWSQAVGCMQCGGMAPDLPQRWRPRTGKWPPPQSWTAGPSAEWGQQQGEAAAG